MTNPKPPDNLFDPTASPNLDLTVDGASVGKDIGAYNIYRGIEIEKLLDVLIKIEFSFPRRQIIHPMSD
jgi:hypothetical protein